MNEQYQVNRSRNGSLMCTCSLQTILASELVDLSEGFALGTVEFSQVSPVRKAKPRPRGQSCEDLNGSQKRDGQKMYIVQAYPDRLVLPTSATASANEQRD